MYYYQKMNWIIVTIVVYLENRDDKKESNLG